jgi:hypothetical protein
MATREIKLGVVSYVDAKGLNQFGTLGETVNVHEDDVERFDRLNVLMQPQIVLVVGTDVADAEGEIADQLAAPVDPIEALDVDGLKAYALENGVDIGRASSEDGIRAKIVEARQAEQV